jgi:hypothetical protein
MGNVTASLCRVVRLSVAALVASPAFATFLGFGPMGYHSGIDLLVRVAAVLLGSASLAGVFAIAGYLYWVHVIQPALAPVVPRRELSAPDAAKRRQAHPVALWN